MPTMPSSVRSDLPARLLLGGVLVVTALLGACGGDTATPPAPPPGVDEVVTGTDAFRFEPDQLEVAPGDRVGLVCEGSLPHNIVVETEAEDVVVVECGGLEAAEGTVDVEPGSYTFFCDIPGHRAAGMVGTVTVG